MSARTGRGQPETNIAINLNFHESNDYDSLSAEQQEEEDARIVEAYQQDMRASGDVVENAALLIASAPELLKALQDVLDAGYYHDRKPAHVTRQRNAHRKARKLIRRLGVRSDI